MGLRRDLSVVVRWCGPDGCWPDQELVPRWLLGHLALAAGGGAVVQVVLCAAGAVAFTAMTGDLAVLPLLVLTWLAALLVGARRRGSPGAT